MTGQMTSMMVALGLFAVGCAAADDTGQEDGSAPAPLAGLGEACREDADCSVGTCWDRGVCVMSCDAHANCGCPVGTTNGDVRSGGCGVACVENQCLKVCNYRVACEGMTVCTPSPLDLYEICR